MKKNLKLCIIDDDKMFRYAIDKVARQTGLVDEVILFKDGEEGINFLKQHQEKTEQLPDLIFLDINMPIMNGWEFLDEFSMLENRLAKKVIVYVVTSSVDKRDVYRSTAHKLVKEYIIKPFDQHKLKEIFHEFLHG